MKIEKINPNIKYLYHYTLKENVDKILSDKEIKSKDEYVFFTKSLEDSVMTFEREIMQEGKPYIDVDGVLRKRGKCNKDDYCILKIPYINDNQFYKFKFENQTKESIYTISISHKGAYRFNNAKIIDIPKRKKLNVWSKTAIVASIAGLMILPYNNTYAASWLDTGNYDISWYLNGTSNNKYILNTAKELAGLAYLVNNNDVTFKGKAICITGDIDLTENKWETIKAIFEGTICGAHRIILNWSDGEFIKENAIDTVEYKIDVLVNDILQQANIKYPYTVQELKDIYGSKAEVIYNGEILSDDKSLFDLNLSKNKIEIFLGLYIFIENEEGTKTPFKVETGDSIDNIKEMYSKKMNIQLDKIIIKYNGKELEDGRTLADYNIQKGGIMQVCIKKDTNINEGKGDIDIEENVTEPKEEKDEKKEQSKADTKLNSNSENKINSNNSEKQDKKIENPKTGDNIITYIITLCVSALGVIFTKIKRKKL